MEYKKYTICPSYTAAKNNLELINDRMLRMGVLKEGELWAVPQLLGNFIRPLVNTTRFYYLNPDPLYLKGTAVYTQTDSNPGEQQLYNYRIYKYLTESGREKFPDPSIMPHAVNYKVDIYPNLYPLRVFDKGYLTKVIWYDYDYATMQPIEEVLKVDVEYTHLNDGIIPAANTIASKKTMRQWAIEDGADRLVGTYIPGNEKITTKAYDTILLQREEGKRRRVNIYHQMTGDITLIWATQLFSAHPNPRSSAESIGFYLIEKYRSNIENFKETGAPFIINDLQTDSDSKFTEILDLVVRDEEPVKTACPQAIGMTVRQFMIYTLSGQ